MEGTGLSCMVYVTVRNYSVYTVCAVNVQNWLNCYDCAYMKRVILKWKERLYMLENPHGGDIYSGDYALDFSVNVNPFGPPEAVCQAVRESAGFLERYPDTSCRELREALSEKLSVLPEQLIFGNGAAELIYALVQALRPRHALVTAPGFAEYEAALKAAGCRIHYYPLKPEHNFLPQEDFFSWITGETELVFLCNPHNPSGAALSREFLLQAARRAGQCGTVLAVDECFWQFVVKENRVTLLDAVNGHPQLFLLHAFTKTYAMPGLRLGYGVSSDQGLLERMRRQMQAWNVSAPAQAAGLAALEETAYVERTAEAVACEREYLRRELTRLGFRVYPSQANFLLFQGPEDLKERCAGKRILIRDCSNYHGLSAGWFRIAVKLHEENETLIQVLERV